MTPAARATAPRRKRAVDHLERMDRYLRGLADGSIPVAEVTRLSARRHFADLERAKSGDCWFYFDEDRASKALRFCHLFPNVKGDIAGRPLEIHPWGLFWIASIFGWQTKTEGTRRFRFAYGWVPRGNCKSTYQAAASNYAAFGEGGQADAFSLATTKEQAGIVWGDAASMIRARPDVKERLGIEVFKTAIVQASTNSSFKRLASVDTSLDGLNVSWANMDELHEIPRALFNVIKTALGKRANSILASISTAGTDSASFGRETYLYCRQVLTGEVQDDLTFALIYEFPEGSDYYSEEAQRAANPMYGLSVRPEILKAAAEKAKRFAGHRTAYLVKHGNVWQSAASAYFDLAKFDEFADPSLKPEQFKGDPCFEGLDLAATNAFACMSKVFVRDLLHRDPDRAAEYETERHYYVFVDSYLNQKAVDESPTDAYKQWANDGWLTVSGENSTDFVAPKQQIIRDLESFDVREIACDPHLMNQLLLLVRDDAPNAPFIEYPQRTQFLSPAMKEMNAAILDGRFHHNGNPVFRWMVGNVEAKEDANENVFPLKAGGKGSPNYIDGVSATLNAIGRILVSNTTGPTYSETRGFVSL